MDETQKKAFDFAADLTKQLITLSTAVLAFTVTFAKDVSGAGTADKIVLIASWIMLILSIGLGILTLMGLTGNLDPVKSMDPAKPNNPILTIRSGNVTGSAKWQIYLFLLGMILTAISGGHFLFVKPDKADQKQTIIIREVQK